MRKGSPHPHVERVVQEQVRQERADGSLNAKGNFFFERTILDWRSGFVLDLRRKR
jgi:hypothetical protein